jgi:hypothetical protein
MATSGSYRKLRDNAVASMISSVEIYNKPRMDYRNEISVILAVNAWELLLKSIVRKNGGSIFIRKVRNGPRNTISIWEALNTSVRMKSWPKQLDLISVRKNLELLNDIRNNVVHFYSATNLSPVLYVGMSASIRNFATLLKSIHGIDLAEQINIDILPIGLTNPIELVESLLHERDSKKSAPDRALASLLREKMDEVKAGTGQLDQLVFGIAVELRSVKANSKKPRVIVGAGNVEDRNAEILFRDRDPNDTHPLTFMDIANELKAKLGLGRNYLSAYLSVQEMTSDAKFCWIDHRTGTKRYSHQARLKVFSAQRQDFLDSLKHVR